MGPQHTAIVTWGFVLDHQHVIRIIKAIEEKKKLDGKESFAPEQGEPIDWEYLEDIFSVVTSQKFSVSFDLDEDTGNTSVSIFGNSGLGRVERWGSESGMCAQSLGAGGLDAKIDAIKADCSKEFEEIKEQLLLTEAGVTVEGQCLLVLETL